PLDDLLDDGETHAHAFELARLVQSLEYTEELAGVTHVEAHAVVAHEVDALTRPLLAADRDARRIAPARELRRIVQQVHQRLAQQARIGVHLAELLRIDVDLDRLDQADVFEDRTQQRPQVDPPALDRPPAHQRETEQVVDQLRHLPDVSTHGDSVILLPFIERTDGFDKPRGVPVDRPQRRPQIVRNAVGERLEIAIGGAQLPIGVLELRGAFG